MGLTMIILVSVGFLLLGLGNRARLPGRQFVVDHFREHID